MSRYPAFVNACAPVTIIVVPSVKLDGKQFLGRFDALLGACVPFRRKSECLADIDVASPQTGIISSRTMVEARS